MEVTKGSLFKGTGRQGVILLGIISEPSNGMVRVVERCKCEPQVHKYLKPVSEIREEVGKVLVDTGKSAPVSEIEEKLSTEQIHNY